MEKAQGLDFHTMPEGCVANVLSLTTPCDACRLSAVSSLFRSAAESNAVWRQFLPADYESIIARFAEAASLRSLPLKDLYMRLCTDPALIDEGRKIFWLDRCSGKKCFMLSARSLSIVWGDTPRYWKWTPSSEPKSRFEEVAMLMNVCWLEIHGKMDTGLLSPETRYGFYFVYKTVNANGFDYQPVKMKVELEGAEDDSVVEKSVYLDMDEWRQQQQQQYIALCHRMSLRINPGRLGGGPSTAPPPPPPPLFQPPPPPLFQPPPPPPRYEQQQQDMKETADPKKRNDGWLEIEMGEFFMEDGVRGKVQMSLSEVKGGNWKSGLIVEGIEVRPK